MLFDTFYVGENSININYYIISHSISYDNKLSSAQLRSANRSSAFNWDSVVTQFRFISVLIWSFWGDWRVLTQGWPLNLDFDMVAGFLYSNILSFGLLSWFWRCKEHQCPLSPDMGFWRMLEVPNWGFASC